VLDGIPCSGSDSHQVENALALGLHGSGTAPAVGLVAVGVGAATANGYLAAPCAGRRIGARHPAVGLRIDN